MIQIPQSTSRVVLLKLYLTGTTTAATGNTVAITLSKNGGAFTNPSAGATNATELSSGWYTVTLSTTDTNTVGDLVVRGTAASCDDSERIFGVVSATTGGLTNLDTTVSSRMETYTQPTGFLAATFPATVSSYAGGTVASVTGDVGGNVVGSVGSVLGAVGSVTGNVGGNVTGSVGSVATGGITAGSIAADAIGASELATDAVTEIASAVWATATRTLSAFGFDVTLATSQPNYAPAKAGDAMILTAGSANALAALVDSAITTSHGSGSYLPYAPVDIWSYGTRTLTGFAFAVDVSGTSQTAIASATATETSTQITTDHGLGLYTRNTEPDNATIAATATSVGTILTTVTAIASAVSSLLVRVPSALFDGITSLGNWLRAGFRKDTPDATALSEINTGGGTFSALTDSIEAIRDRGDIAWIGGGGGETDCPTVEEIADAVEGLLTGDISPTLVSPQSADGGTLYLYPSDDYDDDDGRALEWTEPETGWNYSFSGATVALEGKAAGESIEWDMTIVSATSPKSLRLELTSAQTAVLNSGIVTGHVVLTTSAGSRITLFSVTIEPITL